MKQTPLYGEHTACGARMAEFGGWDMPIQYAGILAEHQHTRTRAGLFDICHMGEFEISGPEATADLENLLTQKIENLQIGQCRYGFMLDNNGGVIDDLTCYRLEDEKYLLVVNAATLDRDAGWIQTHLSPQTVFTDRSDELGKIDLQGPASCAAFEAVIGKPLPDLGYFRCEPFTCLNTEILLSRTGYTGEWGYELYIPVEETVRFWRALLMHEDVKPVGLGARDTLRLEMGYSLYGHELSRDRTPGAVSRGMFIKKEIGFIGRDAVMRDLENPKEFLIALELETRRAARAGDVVFCAGEEVGAVTSGSLSPSLGCAIALAFVKAECDKSEAFEIDVRGKKLSAWKTSLPFYKNGTARG